MKNCTSIFLSLLLLISSSGIAYAQHFCGEYEMMAEITLGKKDLSCGMVMEVPDCDDSDIEDHDCCDNHYTQINTDDTFAKTSFDVKLNKTFVTAFVSAFVLKQVENYTANASTYPDYDPPPLEQDFQVLYETFLI